MSYHDGSNWQAKKEDEGKPLYDKPMEKKTIWQCHNPECNAQYSEYVTGCPKCSTGEPGGSHKVSILDEYHPAYMPLYTPGGTIMGKKYPIDINEFIHNVAALVYYSQIHTVNGVRPAEFPTHLEAWRSTQQWIWGNCKDENGVYKLKQAPTGAVWVKASERLPEITKRPVLYIVKWFDIQMCVRTWTANQLAEWVKNTPMLEYLWLDESRIAGGRT